MNKAIIKFDNIKIEKQKFHKHKIPISIKNIGINKIVVYDRSLFVKRFLDISLAVKILKELDLHVCYSQK